MTHTYPDNTLAQELRKRGFAVHINWEIKGPKDTEIAWMTHLVATDGKSNFGTMIVQTFKDGNGWNVYVFPSNAIGTEATVEAVIKSLEKVPA
jgi:glycerophosphoryl diester phosphodiesterase